MAHYLICYDIADKRRLGLVHRRAVRHAMFVQYSVYYLSGHKLRLRAMLADIESVIHPQEDDVRAYTVAPLMEAQILGRSWLPEDFALT